MTAAPTPTLPIPTHDFGCATWSYCDSVYEHLFNCESCAISTDSMSVVNADLGRTLGKYTVAFGLRNVFDAYPDKHDDSMWAATT
ncbi:MAG: hypothetical protein F4029_10655 [Gammaproteobacteria bacterium]|nr:hypothetical protein [Gammaproteobacteria bacterium]MYF28578.1 hypothetical protein [Gammaproteobacteria bacterium]MYK46674.1 hypothetical protein [Gammaproteobacteria bacterium]